MKIPVLMAVLSAILGFPASADPGGGLRAARIIQANIFGDGNPDNGIEDSRIDMSSPDWNRDARHLWNMSAGTVHCDGENRGSAVIADTQEFGGAGASIVLVTSAHVVYDLQRRRLFRHCRFHYMALDRLRGFQADIDLDSSVLGPFNPRQDRASPEFGEGDWALLHVPEPAPGVSRSAHLGLMPFEQLRTMPGERPAFQFIAYSRSGRNIAISSGCSVTESTAGDLGGGAWKGQLLDDCDSEGGASGGGLVGMVGDQAFLVGIRSGAHWDQDAFPLDQFPEGPPGGTRWDIRRNTNFGRAIDGVILSALRDMVSSLAEENPSTNQIND